MAACRPSPPSAASGLLRRNWSPTPAPLPRVVFFNPLPESPASRPVAGAASSRRPLLAGAPPSIPAPGTEPRARISPPPPCAVCPTSSLTCGLLLAASCRCSSRAPPSLCCLTGPPSSAFSLPADPPAAVLPHHHATPSLLCLSSTSWHPRWHCCHLWCFVAVARLFALGPDVASPCTCSRCCS